MYLAVGPKGFGRCRLAFSAHRTAMEWMRLLERPLLRLDVYSLVANTHRHDSRWLGCCLVGLLRIHLRCFRCHPTEEKHNCGAIAGPVHHENDGGAEDEGQEQNPREVDRQSLDPRIAARCFGLRDSFRPFESRLRSLDLMDLPHAPEGLGSRHAFLAHRMSAGWIRLLEDPLFIASYGYWLHIYLLLQK